MVTDQLLSYVKEQLAAGVSKDAIQNALAGQGWSLEDIQQALAASAAPAVVVQPVQKPHLIRRIIKVFLIILLSLIIVAVVSLAASVFFKSLGKAREQASQTTTPAPSSATPAATTTIGVITVGSDGWSRYTNPETGFTFSYPPTWVLQEQLFEQKQPEGSVSSVYAQGNGYAVEFFAIGKEYPSGVSTRTVAYTIDGKKVSGYENVDKDGIGFMQGFGVCGGSLIVGSADNTNKDITDKIISSVHCSSATR